MVHQKFLLQYIVCADTLSNMSCCLVRQQSRLMFMLVISITGILLDMSNHEPYLCMGFDCSWCVSASIITLTKNQECHHQQDDYACLLLSSQVILAITFLVASTSLHCQVDVTSSQSKHSVC